MSSKGFQKEKLVKGKALEDLKILELGNFISAAYCTKLFADLGAEVIKIEEPNVGDEARRYGPFPGDIPHQERSGLFLYLNANKQGITLNLRTSTGRKVFKQLIEKIDILVENNPPQVMEKYELTYDALSQVNSRLIMASITPFGQTGPYKYYKAYAINSAAAGGESIITGEPGREPLTPPLSLSHYEGGVTAAMAIMFALLSRKKSGHGTYVDVSEAEAWACLHTSLMVHHFVFNNRKRTRTGHRTLGFYPYTILPCKDGYVSLIALLGQQWKRFLELIGGGEIPQWYANDPRFEDRWQNSLKYADELDSLLAPWLMSHTKEEIFTLCQENHIPFTHVRTIEEVVNATDLEDREAFIEVEHPQAGKVKCPGLPYKFSNIAQETKPAPLLGEHNKRIYCELLGYTEEDFANLRKEETV